MLGKPFAAFRADRDAFGHLLQDQLNGEPAVEIIERDDEHRFAAGECRRFLSEQPD